MNNIPIPDIPDLERQRLCLEGVLFRFWAAIEAGETLIIEW